MIQIGDSYRKDNEIWHVVTPPDERSKDPTVLLVREGKLNRERIEDLEQYERLEV